MTSLRHNDPPGFTPDDTLLDAARECILAVGWRRTTLTEVARRAGVSRMTLYRRWPDMQTLLADLMTREWGGLALPPGDGSPLDRVASGVTTTVTALRGNELFAKILHVDPELLLPYLLDRRGRTQDALLAVLTEEVAAGQREGAVRDGDPALLARSVLLASYGFALSVPTMADDDVSVAGLDEELRLLVERYLAR
jgi:AcrR family transcriptional regulator